MIKEVGNRSWNSLGIEEKEKRKGGGYSSCGYHRAIQSISPKFFSTTHSLQCCAAAQHKSSTVMNEHPPAHTLDQ